jgi:hypothetical protein
MPWSRFLPFNAAGGIVWATIYGTGGYVLGKNVNRLTGPVGIATVIIAAIIIIIVLVVLKRNEKRLEEEAVRAIAGPLEVHQLRQAGQGYRRPRSADDQMPEQTHPQDNVEGSV